MGSIGPGQARFRIHGPDPDRDGLVSGSLFANKLATLVRALKEADRQVNDGRLVHDYKIIKLESTSPTVTLGEFPIPTQKPLGWSSGVTAFEDCAAAIIAGDDPRALKYGRCIHYIGDLAGGAQRTYGYGEVWTGGDHITRVDKFLAEQAAAITHPEVIRPTHGDKDWFKGIVEASFDGTIKAVDLRGELPEIKLIMTAGGKQLDCVCHAVSVESIRDNLDMRVRVYGRAIYDGRSGLPRRVEVREIEPIARDADFNSWRGAFEPFEPPDWDIDDA